MYLACESNLTSFNHLIPPGHVMDDLICIGCARSFSTRKSLSAHKAQFSANKALTIDIHHHHGHSKKAKKQKCINTSPIPGCSPQSQHTVRFSTPVKIEDLNFNLR